MTKKALILLILLLGSMPVFAQVDTAWVRVYNGPESGYDKATAIAVDDSGNVYITGESQGGCATIKYDTDGSQVWVSWYYCWATDIDVDDSGSVYITGYCGTIKYSKEGSQLWMSDSSSEALSLDQAGNAYTTCTGGDYLTDYYRTIKYYQNGQIAWVRRYSFPARDFWGAWAAAIRVDATGNAHVTGFGGRTDSTMVYATLKYDSVGNQLWVREYPDNPAPREWNIASDLAVDTSGNVYVTGVRGPMSSLPKYVTIKYGPNGESLWVRSYPGAADTITLPCLGLDGAGNLYLVGSEIVSGVGYDFLIIKYSPGGDQVWVRHYGGLEAGDDHAQAVAVDESGNVYVTGNSEGDLTTIKYNQNGDSVWVTGYPGAASAIAVDDSENVYVTGESWGSGTEYDYVTIKYVQRQESITVVFPNGGETLYVDARYDITWSWTYVESVKIEYSTNGGSSWLSITGSTESDGSYSWVVPNTPSDNCLVKISDAKDGDPVDTSDAYFTIMCEPMIVVKSPNGRECWRVGTTYDITWDRFCFYDGVLIEYTTNNGGSWDTIVETTTNDGLYPWTIPDTPSDSCLIRISDVVDHIPSDTSNKVFSIVIWVRGDANGDGVINVTDVVYLINYLFLVPPGPAPNPLAAGDANSDGTINVTDVVYLINYLFLVPPGPPPGC